MNEGPERVQILDARAARAKINRMAFEIYESNFGAAELLVLGLNERGSYLADLLAERLRAISPIQVQQLRALHRDHGFDIQSDNPGKAIQGRPVLIVDDVLYSGTTLFKAMAAVFPLQPARIQTAVLIDRGHRNLPVSHDFVGILLATTLQQHVSVEIADVENSAIAYVQ